MVPAIWHGRYACSMAVVLAAVVLCGVLTAQVTASDSESEAHSARGLNDDNSAFAVVGYLPEWRYGGTNWELLSQYVTHIILFSLEVGPDGSLAALDRVPAPAVLQRARSAAAAAATKLLICFGGNARSAGFSPMVRSAAARGRFIETLVAFLEEHGLDGVDYNWEYPRDKEDWFGLFTLLKETRAALAPSGRMITMAYYPDSRQEQILKHGQVYKYVDLLHMMSYDQPGEHSTWAFGVQSVRQGLEHLPRRSLTMGLPFYSRHVATGDWKTYEDLVKAQAARVNPHLNRDTRGNFYNGIEMIENKTKHAREMGLGGVMIWELGQDCLSGVCGEGGEFDTESTALLAAVRRAASPDAPVPHQSRHNEEL